MGFPLFRMAVWIMGILLYVSAFYVQKIKFVETWSRLKIKTSGLIELRGPRKRCTTSVRGQTKDLHCKEIDFTIFAKIFDKTEHEDYKLLIYADQVAMVLILFATATAMFLGLLRFVVVTDDDEDEGSDDVKCCAKKFVCALRCLRITCPVVTALAQVTRVFVLTYWDTKIKHLDIRVEEKTMLTHAWVYVLVAGALGLAGCVAVMLACRRTELHKILEKLETATATNTRNTTRVNTRRTSRMEVGSLSSTSGTETETETED